MDAHVGIKTFISRDVGVDADVLALMSNVYHPRVFLMLMSTLVLELETKNIITPVYF